MLPVEDPRCAFACPGWRAVHGEIRPVGSKAKDDPRPAFRKPEVLDEIRGTRDECFALFLTAVIEGIEDGSLRDDAQPYYVARSIASLAHGLAMEALDEQLEEGEVSSIVEVAVDGLKRPD